MTRLRSWSLLLLLLALAACQTREHQPTRADVIARSLSSTVQLLAQREDGVRRAGSGVVVARDGDRLLIATAAHVLEPLVEQTITVSSPLTGARVPGRVLASDPARDIALVEVRGMEMEPVVLKREAGLGDNIWVVAFPWGRQRTIVTGIVSQIAWDEISYPAPVRGAPRLVDAPVNFGSSGGGIYDSESGLLVGIVRGYRTAQLSLPIAGSDPVELPVAGETTVVAARDILCFLEEAAAAEAVAVFPAAAAPGDLCPSKEGAPESAPSAEAASR